MSAKSATKKKSKKDEPEATYDIGDLVLGRVKGYPPWPSIVVDPDNVPKQVSKERPNSRKSVAYAIRFFPAGDYAWLSAPDLARLTIADCNSYIEVNEASAAESKAKNKRDMLDGYKACLDPEAWEREHDAAAPPPKKKGGKKKKSKGGEEDDDEDGDGEGDEEAVGEDDDEETGKKRKRAPAKKATPQKKKGGKTKKSKETVESEEDGEGEGDDAETKERPSKKAKGGDAVNPALNSDPEALKVREWRHRLQKIFLNSSKAMPKEEDMPAVDELFTTIEQYENMNIEYLTFSKIGKVMRHINVVAEGQIPRDAEFRFRDRAKALVDRWHQILSANKPEVNGNGNAAAEAEGGDLTMLDDAQAE